MTFAPMWLAGLLAAQPAAPAPPGCVTPTLCGADTLGPLLGRLQTARGRPQAPVHILQIGDSHTAGDMITGPLRTRLQARFGPGGRGVLAAGRPYAGYLTFGVTASETPGWTSNVIFGSRWQPSGPALGLSGFTRTARAAGQRIGVTADSADFHFNKVVVCALTGPGQGAIDIRLGSSGAGFLWPLSAPAPRPECRSFESPTSFGAASLSSVDSRPVSITSLATFRSGGVAVSNVGVVGAQLTHFGRTDDRVLAEELRAYQPDLVVLAYGTNEGFSPSLDLVDYERVLRAQIARLRRHLGDTPIMLLGAPSAAARPRIMASVGCGGGTAPPALLEQVRNAQRRVARELGLAFWDWERAMGGRCAVQAWVGQGLMRSDLVHFTRAGGERIGELMFNDLDRVPAAPTFQHPEQRQEPAPPVRRRP